MSGTPRAQASGKSGETMALPTFLIIGAMKCGTTSLHYYLRLHPEIQIPTLKELNFFSGPPDRFPYPTGARRITDLAEYESMFDAAFPARGEASPNYTVSPRREGVPEKIKELVPDARLIYLVRDPIDRTVGQYQLQVATANERRSLRDAIEAELSDPCSLYVCPTFYARQLEQYLEHFASDRILVIDQAALLHDRRATLREVFSFVGVDDTFDSERFSEKLNTSEAHRTYSRFVVMSRFARGTPLLHLPRGLRVFVRRGVERLVTRPLPPPVLDADLRERLRELYADDVMRLRQMTGKTFPTWSV
jgi:hypothetical protein